MLHYPWDKQPEHDQEVLAISEDGRVYSAYFDYINGCFFSNPGYQLIDKKIIAWSELGKGEYIHEQVFNSELIQSNLKGLTVKYSYATIGFDGLVTINIIPYAAIEEITVMVGLDEIN